MNIERADGNKMPKSNVDNFLERYEIYMSKEKDRINYEISSVSPTWLDPNFPSDEEYASVKEVVKFYLINSPCYRSSARGTDLSIGANHL